MENSYEDILAISNEINEAKEKIAASFTEIQDAIDTLLDSWIGLSANNFSTKFSDFSSASNNLLTEIENSALYLKKIVNNYQNIDQQIISSN